MTVIYALDELIGHWSNYRSSRVYKVMTRNSLTSMKYAPIFRNKHIVSMTFYFTCGFFSFFFLLFSSSFYSLTCIHPLQYNFFLSLLPPPLSLSLSLSLIHISKVKYEEEEKKKEKKKAHTHTYTHTYKTERKGKKGPWQ